MKETLIERIMRHEGFCEFPKPDNQFKGNAYVIGYGCDITLQEAKTIYKDGITQEDAASLLEDRLNAIETHLFTKFPWMLEKLDEDRQSVFAEMAFQIGVNGVSEFKNTMALAESGDYQECAKHMLQSLWHKQTPVRSEELADIMAGSNE